MLYHINKKYDNVKCLLTKNYGLGHLTTMKHKEKIDIELSNMFNIEYKKQNYQLIIFLIGFEKLLGKKHQHFSHHMLALL